MIVGMLLIATFAGGLCAAILLLLGAGPLAAAAGLILTGTGCTLVLGLLRLHRPASTATEDLDLRTDRQAA